MQIPNTSKVKRGESEGCIVGHPVPISMYYLRKLELSQDTLSTLTLIFCTAENSPLLQSLN